LTETITLICQNKEERKKERILTIKALNKVSSPTTDKILLQINTIGKSLDCSLSGYYPAIRVRCVKRFMEFEYTPTLSVKSVILTPGRMKGSPFSLYFARLPREGEISIQRGSCHRL